MKIFKHVPDFSFGSLTESYNEKGRFYKTPSGDVYPSVTTVLGNASDSTWLSDWKKAVGEKEAEKVSRIAKSRGSNFHSICENFLRNDPNPTKGFMSLEKTNFKSVKEELEKNVGLIAGLELPLWSDSLKVAGRCDCIAKWKGKWSIVDFKTSKKIKKEEDIADYFEQTSAYAEMFMERTESLGNKIEIENIVIIMTVDFLKPIIFEKRPSDYIGSFIDKRAKVFEYLSEVSG